MNLLIIEDNDGLREQMKWALNEHYEVLEAATSAQALEIITMQKPPLVCLDMGLDNVPDKGLQIIDEALMANRQIKIVVITANTSEVLGVEAIKRGAFDYLRKPVDIDLLRMVIERAARLSSLQTPLAEKDGSIGVAIAADRSIIGSSPIMKNIFSVINKLGRTDVNVLITGESGTGKELCARAIHYHSARRELPFVPINCGAIPETLLESELFGYVKGAFTGALTDKKGLIHSAGEGTLFLDEIGDMPRSLQVKLLRFIEDQMFQPLGSTELIRSNVRIIAATNRLQDSDGESSALRSDLYYRLSEFEINMPPLRERSEDVVLIAQTLIERNRLKFSMPRLSLSSRAQTSLMRYSWPGNVRELENKLSRAAILCANQTIEPADLQLGSTAFESHSLKQARDLFEKEFVEQALHHASGNISAAATELDISRPTLYDLIKKHGISTPER